jgi:ubiquinone/menaquinone biosynthesis C-methylase UbiE
MGNATETFQIPLAVAEMYEAKFVPALFAEWAPRLVGLAGVAPGHAVLDVACGTGIVARTAADCLGGRGRVVGVDLNEAMLTVARRVRPELEWRQGDVRELPFPDESFDVVLCQMALMFFPDRAPALREMRRVVRESGTVAVVVPSGLRTQPAYAPFVEMAARHAGPDAVSLLGTYFVCGDLTELTGLVRSAGLEVLDTQTRRGHVRLDSADEFVAVEVKSTPLGERVSEAVYEKIRQDAREVLRPFTTPSGAVEVPLEGHLVAARRAW